MTPTTMDAIPPQYDEEWDAGDLGCGDLVLRLRFKLKAMQSGQIIRVRATDLGAPMDLPAWARLTGDALVYRDNANCLYYFRRKT